MTEILVLYYSRNGSTAELARQVCRGIESVSGVAKLRTVPAVARRARAPRRHPPAGRRTPRSRICVRRTDSCSAAPRASATWQRPEVLSRRHLQPVALRRALGQTCRRVYLHTDHARRPGNDLAVDDAAPAAPRHVPRRHPLHGARAERHAVGGSPYGASHVAANQPDGSLTEHERDLAQVLGRRVAILAAQLACRG